jgi:hypothetical protein
MVGMDKVKRGIARYLDEEFTNKMTGWQKWVFGTAAAMFIENFASISNAWRENPMVKSLGLMDDSGNVAVERIYQHLRVQAQKGPITFDIPMMGSVTLREADVERLYTCIMQA